MSRRPRRRRGDAEGGLSQPDAAAPRPAAETQPPRLRFSDTVDADALIAYLHLRRGTPAHTKAVLEGHIRSFAASEGFDLRRLLVGTEGGSDLLTLRELVEQIEVTGAERVLVVGPAREALVALHRMSGVQVLTLAQVRPSGQEWGRGRSR